MNTMQNLLDHAVRKRAETIEELLKAQATIKELKATIKELKTTTKTLQE